MKLTDERLTAFATSILSEASGAPGAAAKVATRLVSANLMGHDSHGVGMIPAYVEGILAEQLIPNGTATIVQDKGPFLLWGPFRAHWAPHGAHPPDKAATSQLDFFDRFFMKHICSV